MSAEESRIALARYREGSLDWSSGLTFFGRGLGDLSADWWGGRREGPASALGRAEPWSGRGTGGRSVVSAFDSLEAALRLRAAPLSMSACSEVEGKRTCSYSSDLLDVRF